jgi:hypothetical protein
MSPNTIASHAPDRRIDIPTLSSLPIGDGTIVRAPRAVNIVMALLRVATAARP